MYYVIKYDIFQHIHNNIHTPCIFRRRTKNPDILCRAVMPEASQFFRLRRIRLFLDYPPSS